MRISNRIIPPSELQGVPEVDVERGGVASVRAANLSTKTLEFGGLDSSRIVILRCGILRSIGDFPESLSQAILVGTIFN